MRDIMDGVLFLNYCTVVVGIFLHHPSHTTQYNYQEENTISSHMFLKGTQV